MRSSAPAVLLLALAAAGCDRGQPPAPGAGPGPGRGGGARLVAVEVQPTQAEDVPLVVTALGSLEPREVVRIPARVPGVVEDIVFTEGMEVRKGQVLARIDPQRYGLEADRAEARLREAEAALREAESALERRRTLRERNPGWVAEEEIESHSARVDQARATVDGLRAELALAREDAADAQVRSTAAGVIEEKLVETGQQVAAGQPIATIVDASRLRLAFKLSETEALRIGDGSTVTFQVKGLPDREFRASLYHLGEAADPATRQVQALAWVDDPGPLRPGTFADVAVSLRRGDGADAQASVVVPESAVLPGERGFTAWVIAGPEGEDGGRPVELRRLTLGLRTADGRVEVTSGLQPGELLVVRGGASLQPASRVRIAEPAASPAEARR